MPLPNPELGLIVHYSYLFLPRTRNIGDAGKNRPCMIMAVFQDPDDPLKTGILYLPITHSPPSPDEQGVALPADAKFAAGLDAAPQWVLVSQGNRDTWPEDIFNLPNQPGVLAYGFLPPRMFKIIQGEFARLFAARRFNLLPRNNML